jgi:small-conductance mechanosensitive channel
LSSLTEKIFTHSRVKAMLEGLRRRCVQAQGSLESKVKHLTKELTEVQQRSQKLYDAVEKGLLPEDSTLTERANKLQARRQALLTEIAELRRQKTIPGEMFGEKKVQAFTSALRERLLGKDKAFSRKYLKLLVDEIRYRDRQLVMKGSYAAVARATGETKVGTPQGEVPRFVRDWLANGRSERTGQRCYRMLLEGR